MSADNGIFVMEFTDGYRVAYASAIDNITYDPDYQGFNKRYLQEYFGGSKVYQSHEEATECAMDILKNFLKHGYIVEYGVCDIHVEKPFPYPIE